ncbi:MAG TPA: hypothetical protein VGL34_03945 [Steroidobacteraceae bacterium]
MGEPGRGAYLSWLCYGSVLEPAFMSKSTAIAAGRHILSIDYHGNIGRSTLGFFAMD